MLVVRALRTVGLRFPLTVADIVTPTAAFLLLLVAHLYETLPQLEASPAVVDFGQVLMNDDVTKKVELRNTSKASSSFKLQLVGDAEFALEGRSTSTVTVPAGGSASLVVKFRCSAVGAREAALYAVGGSKGAGPDLRTFALRATVQPRVSGTLPLVQTPCYRELQRTVQLRNPFSVAATFAVSWPQLQLGKKRPAAQPTADGPARPCFWTDEKEVQLPAGGTATVMLHYLPTSLGQHQATLQLDAPGVGQGFYVVRGEAGPPEPGQQLTADASLPEVRVHVPRHNRQRQQALVQLSNAFERSFVLPETADEPVTLAVQASGHACFQAPPSVTVPAGAAEADLTVQLDPTSAGTFGTTLQLTGPDDYRVVVLETTVLEHTTSTVQLHATFPVPASHTVSFHNHGAEPQVLCCLFRGHDGAGGCPFSGADRLEVAPGATAHYEIKFVPPWPGTYAGELLVQDMTAGHSQLFVLQGSVDPPEPVAEYRFLCQMGTRTHHEVELVNRDASLPCQYKVYCDLEAFSGAETMTVPPGRTVTYAYQLEPRDVGEAHGILSFVDTARRDILTYRMTVLVSQPMVLPVTCSPGQRTTLAVPVVNPTDTAMSFATHVHGDAATVRCVQVAASCVVEAHDQTTVPVVFAPTEPLPDQDVRLTLHASEFAAGELLVLLRLSTSPTVGSDTAVQPLDSLEAPLGQAAFRTLPLMNPTEEAVCAQLACTDAAFTINPPRLVLHPHSSDEVQIAFAPMAVATVECEIMVYLGATVPPQRYRLTGTGLPPAPLPEELVHARVGAQGAHEVQFRNPFAEPVSVAVQLAAHSSAEFALLKNQASVAVRPRGVLWIPVSFTPTAAAAAAAATVMVRVTRGDGDAEPVVLEYPLRGVTESVAADKPLVLRATARERVTKMLHLPLPGLRLPDAATAAPELSLQATPAVRQALHMTLQPPLVAAAQDGVVRAPVQVELTAHRGGTSQATAVLRFQQHVWRFPVLVEVQEAAADDTIVLQARTPSEPSAVGFRLNSHSPVEDAPFMARITGPGAASFRVEPAEGYLPARGTEGLLLTVSYQPPHAARARLYVETTTHQWIYDLRGAMGTNSASSRSPARKLAASSVA